MRAVHFLVPLALAQPVFADCTVSPAFVFASKKGKVTVSAVHIGAVPGTILRYRASSEVNTDGSALSYHPGGTDAGALNSLCNATNAKLADGTTYSGIVTKADKARESYARLDQAGQKQFGRSKCNKLIAYAAEAREHGYDPKTFPKLDFYAVAKRRDGRPCIAPSGFFVSQVSAMADPTIKDDCNPAKWLDSLTIAAIVIPKKSSFLAYPGYAIGSGSLVLARVSGSFAEAVVGDIGPADGLGEITPRLAWRLQPESPDPTTLPGAQLAARIRAIHLPGPEYFVFTQMTVRDAPGQLPADPRKRRPTKIDNATIAAAFARIDKKAVEKELQACVFPGG